MNSFKISLDQLDDFVRENIYPFVKKNRGILLNGELGSGKTTLVRSIIRQFLPNQEVVSPTFTLVQEYQLADFRIVHMDLYRIKDKGELLELGIEDYFDNDFVIIEWPDILGSFLPQESLVITLDFTNSTQARQISIIHGLPKK